MARSSTLTVDSKLKKELDRLSKVTNRSRSFVAGQAFREYVELNNWQIAETIKGLAEADRGEFATDKEMKQTFKKWTRRAR
jgi:RHH-type transcriptional regulator, rel operon repressor / antitoxin RelB